MNGRMEAASFEYDAVIEFSCDDGYDLVGNETLHCGDIDGVGVWSSPKPVCKGTSDVVLAFNSKI